MRQNGYYREWREVCFFAWFLPRPEEVARTPGMKQALRYRIGFGKKIL
jgi:hypothetical protein